MDAYLTARSARIETAVVALFHQAETEPRRLDEPDPGDLTGEQFARYERMLETLRRIALASCAEVE
jgi:hypothetical protein